MLRRMPRFSDSFYSLYPRFNRDAPVGWKRQNGAERLAAPSAPCLLVFAKLRLSIASFHYKARAGDEALAKAVPGYDAIEVVVDVYAFQQTLLCFAVEMLCEPQLCG